MQLYVIDWSFQNNEDQLFATNEFCQYLNEGKLNQSIDGFELQCIAHTPQNGTGVKICKVDKDVILSTNTMHHIEDINGVVEGMGELIKDNGTIITEDPSLNDNASGFTNFAAPGADRLQIKISLMKKDLDDTNDQNFIEIARVQASARLALVSAQSALAREESRGCHHRSDFTESSEEHLHHYTVNQIGEVNTLALRKSKTGNWILPPQ